MPGTGLTGGKGHQVHLRIDALLDELEPRMQRLRPNFAKRASGLTANWVYWHWSTGGVLVGFGMSPSGLVSPLPDDPVVFAFVGNASLEEHDAMAAVGVDAISRSTWLRNDALDARCGLVLVVAGGGTAWQTMS